MKNNQTNPPKSLAPINKLFSLQVMTLFKLGCNELADTKTNQYLKNNPKSEYTYIAKCKYYFEQKKYATALKYAKIAYITNPNLFSTANSVSACYYHDDTYSLKQRMNSALKYINKALLNEPKNPEGLRNKGLILLQLKKHKKAIDCHQKSNKHAKEYFCGYLGSKITEHNYDAISWCYYKMGKFDKALMYNDKVIKIAPLSRKYIRNKAMYSRGHEYKIHQFILKIRKLKKIKFKSHELKLHKLYKFKYKRAIQEDPANSSAAFFLGGSYASVGKLQKAIKYYNLAIKINPNYIIAIEARTSAHIKLKQNNKGLIKLLPYKKLFSDNNSSGFYNTYINYFIKEIQNKKIKPNKSSEYMGQFSYLFQDVQKNNRVKTSSGNSSENGTVVNSETTIN